MRHHVSYPIDDDPRHVVMGRDEGIRQLSIAMHQLVPQISRHAGLDLSQPGGGGIDLQALQGEEQSGPAQSGLPNPPLHRPGSYGVGPH